MLSEKVPYLIIGAGCLVKKVSQIHNNCDRLVLQKQYGRSSSNSKFFTGVEIADKKKKITKQFSEFSNQITKTNLLYVVKCNNKSIGGSLLFDQS